MSDIRGSVSIEMMGEIGIDIVILAAGNGSRMLSSTSKVLHTIGNLPIINHVINLAKSLNPSNIIIVKDPSSDFDNVEGENFIFVDQIDKGGTAAATKLAMPFLENEIVIILYADTPLIKKESIESLCLKCSDNSFAACIIGFNPEIKEHTYGRVALSDNGRVSKIIEYYDYDPSYNSSKEDFIANSGVLAIKRGDLEKYIPMIKNDNSKSEYYLTDIIKILIDNNLNVAHINVPYYEAQGVNCLMQLSGMELEYQRQKKLSLMQRGVKFILPDTTYVSYDTEFGDNCVIYPNNYFGCNVKCGDNVIFKPNCVIEKSLLSSDIQIGPFAHLRDNNDVSSNSIIGNFTEIKESKIGKYSKIKHHSYIGNTLMGENVNIGAGTIICNYNGKGKNTTSIGDNSFIGANNSIVAPVSIGDYVKTGASTTIRLDVESNTKVVHKCNNNIVNRNTNSHNTESIETNSTSNSINTSVNNIKEVVIKNIENIDIET